MLRRQANLIVHGGGHCPAPTPSRSTSLCALVVEVVRPVGGDVNTLVDPRVREIRRSPLARRSGCGRYAAVMRPAGAAVRPVETERESSLQATLARPDGGSTGPEALDRSCQERPEKRASPHLSVLAGQEPRSPRRRRSCRAECSCRMLSASGSTNAPDTASPDQGERMRGALGRVSG